MRVRATVAVLHVAATVALRNGRRTLAQRMWTRALTVARHAPSSPGTRYLQAHCLAGLAAADIQAGRYGRAGALASDGLALVGRSRRWRDRLAASILHNHAGIAARLGGEHELARAHYQAALATNLRGARVMAASRGAVVHNLGGLAFAEGRLSEAERLTAEAARLHRWAPLQRAGDLGMLGAIVAAQGRLDEGERLIRGALAVFRRRYGSGHREIAFALGNLAEIRRLHGDADDAARLAEQALAVGERSLGPEHSELAPILNTLALIGAAQGDADTAHALLVRANRLLTDGVCPSHPARRASDANLAILADRRRGRGQSQGGRRLNPPVEPQPPNRRWQRRACDVASSA
jgi:tetratricopeptide (TPR) repeat protein